jgi:hypothetical protein
MSEEPRKTSPPPGLCTVALFKSVAILVDGSDPAEMVPCADVLTDWIPRFSSWYTGALRSRSVSSLQHLYDREVALLGNSVLEHEEELAKIARVARPLGYGVSLTLDASYALEMRAPLARLLATQLISSIGVVVRASDGDGGAAETLKLLEEIAATKVGIGIIGEFRSLVASGALESDVLSPLNLTWYPLSPEAGALAMPARPVRGCFGRFRLHVDPAGDLFPCLGLLGVEAFCLGNLRDPVEETLLADPTVMGRLTEWAVDGPAIAGSESTTNRFGLPPMCEHHLTSLGL